MSGPGPEASVVIPTVGRPQLLRRTLDAVLSQELDASSFEVIVVGDGADPGTAALLAELRRDREDDRDGRPSLSYLVRNGGPGSPGATRNLGIERARGALVAFLDDDCAPVAGWLAAALRAHEAEPDALVQGPTLPDPDGAGGRDPFSRIARIERLGPHFQSCNVFYPRELLARIGGFDPAFERWGEDVDLAWRAIEAGAPTAWAEGALVHHAVIAEGPLGHLRFAGREAATVRLMRRHPGLREETAYARFFVKRSHARLLLAVVGAVLSRRAPAAALLTLPYLKGLRGRVRERGGGPELAAYLLAYDLLELGVTARAAASERVPLI